MTVNLDKYDTRFSLVVREAADWTCQICGIQCRTESMANIQMQCMHDRSRSINITRLDPRNAICGCASCHTKTTQNPHLHHREFVRVKGAEEVKLNEERSYSGRRLKKWEKDEVYKHYKNELARIKELRMDGKQGQIEIEIPEVLL